MTPLDLRTARRTLDWTNEQLREALGISSENLREWLRGRYRVHPSAARLIQIWLLHPETRPKFPPHERKLRNC